MGAVMTLNIIPTTMHALHSETQEWHVLSRDSEAYWTHGQPASECFYIDDGEGGEWADLADYDQFEGFSG
jgi:hypothetical protein